MFTTPFSFNMYLSASFNDFSFIIDNGKKVALPKLVSFRYFIASFAHKHPLSDRFRHFCYYIIQSGLFQAHFIDTACQLCYNHQVSKHKSIEKKRILGDLLDKGAVILQL